MEKRYFKKEDILYQLKMGWPPSHIWGAYEMIRRPFIFDKDYKVQTNELDEAHKQFQKLVNEILKEYK